MGDNIMKKIFLLLAVMLVINQNMFSQDADNDAGQDTNQDTNKNTKQDKRQDKNQIAEKKFTIQASPLLWFSDVFADDSNDTLFAMDLEGQLKITNSVNLALTLSFLIDNHTVIDDSKYRDESYKENVYQINMKPMFIYRPFYTGLGGFYLGFYPNVGVLHVENNEVNRFYTELGFGINWGYKWVFRSGFTMQVSNGIGRTFLIPEWSRQYISINSDGSIPLAHTDIQFFGFKLGYSF